MIPGPRPWGIAIFLSLGIVLAVACKKRDASQRKPTESGLATTMSELYGLKSVPTFDIQISEGDSEALALNPKKWRRVSFAYEGQSYPGVALRIKGHRSLRPIDEKPSLKLRFDKGEHKGRSFLGVHRLTLNNLVEDPTMIREYLAYRLARKVGLPVPKAGFANLRVNGDLRGLYLVVETPDSDFLERRFGSAEGELYEGEYGCDLFVEDVPGFEQDVGNSDRSHLLRLAQTAQQSVDALWNSKDGGMSLEHLSLFLAFSNYVGDFDGYHHSHNYRLYRDPRDNRWSMMSWGLDRAFFKELTAFSSQGLLAQKCFADGTCRDAYLHALQQVHAAAQELDLATGARVITTIIADSVKRDSRRPHSNKAVDKARSRLLSFLEGRAAYVDQSTACLKAGDVDGDGQACNDCNDADPRIFTGAAEVCDGVDNNCSGFVDDSPDCPCAIEEVAGKRLAICTLRQPYNVAEQYCQAKGGTLVSFEKTEELALVRAAVDKHIKEAVWTGASDRAVEGSFQWPDGRPVDAQLWSRGEPDNNACNQDCAILHAKKRGVLHDSHCAQRRAFVCAL